MQLLMAEVLASALCMGVFTALQGCQNTVLWGIGQAGAKQEDTKHGIPAKRIKGYTKNGVK